MKKTPRGIQRQCRNKPGLGTASCQSGEKRAPRIGNTAQLETVGSARHVFGHLNLISRSVSFTMRANCGEPARRRCKTFTQVRRDHPESSSSKNKLNKSRGTRSEDQTFEESRMRQIWPLTCPRCCRAENVSRPDWNRERNHANSSEPS